LTKKRKANCRKQILVFSLAFQPYARSGTSRKGCRVFRGFIAAQLTSFATAPPNALAAQAESVFKTLKQKKRRQEHLFKIFSSAHKNTTKSKILVFTMKK